MWPEGKRERDIEGPGCSPTGYKYPYDETEKETKKQKKPKSKSYPTKGSDFLSDYFNTTFDKHHYF